MVAQGNHSHVGQLGAELLAQPDSSRANHAARLISLLPKCDSEAHGSAAVQALKIFFLKARQDADTERPEKRAKTSGPSAGSDGDGDSASAEDVYRLWVAKQYALYIGVLFQLLGSKTAGAAVQIAATNALFEAVRSEGGTGVFSIKLFQRLLAAILEGATVQPQVLALLLTKYLPFSDVKYHALVGIKALADKLATTRPAPVSTPAAAEARGADGGEPGAPAAPLERDDIIRNMMDVLCAVGVPPAPSSATASAAGGGGDFEMRSWCGLAEVGAVTAATDRNASSKSRRKLKARAAEVLAAAGAGGPGGRAAGEQQQQQRAVWANSKSHKRMFSEAWLAFLQLPLPRDMYRKVLLRLAADVLPHMTNPLLLSDFLTNSIDQGGLTGMLALHGLFLLVTRHGLEYGPFFRRLYGLLTPRAFVSAQRAQFFRLADVFLSSGLVPAYTAAAFAKKFARLALTAPPAGAMIAIAFIHNILRRHPSCVVLLHNPKARSRTSDLDLDVSGDQAYGDDDGAQPPAAAATAPGDASAAAAVAASSSGGPGADPYDERETDPARSRGVESSLWELLALRNHYSAQVAAFTSILDKDLTDRVKTSEVDLAPLLTASYSSLLNAETSRRVKAAPVAFYRTVPSCLFDAASEADFVGWAPPAPSS